ncbi:MAG: DUF1801 domain-containing protein [Parafilimonas sp.]
MKKYTSVEEYLMDVPDDKRIALENLRKTIRSVAPKAEEVISYQIPTFKYKGGLVSYAAFKNHCSLFPWNAGLTKKFTELKDYSTSKGTIHFTVDKPIPVALVKKIIKLRMRENEERMLAKKSKEPVKNTRK